MEFTELQTDGVIVLAPAGRIDATNTEAFQKKLLAMLGDQPVRLALDCAQVKYISSIGLRALIVAAKRAAAVKGKFVLCALPPHVRQIIDLGGLSAVIPIHGTRAEAVAALQ